MCCCVHFRLNSSDNFFTQWIWNTDSRPNKSKSKNSSANCNSSSSSNTPPSSRQTLQNMPLTTPRSSRREGWSSCLHNQLSMSCACGSVIRKRESVDYYRLTRTEQAFTLPVTTRKHPYRTLHGTSPRCIALPTCSRPCVCNMPSSPRPRPSPQLTRTWRCLFTIVHGITWSTTR